MFPYSWLKGFSAMVPDEARNHEASGGPELNVNAIPSIE